MALPWEKECFSISSQIPLLVLLQDSDTITLFEIWWKWQVNIENVNFNPVIITLFGPVYLCLFSFLPLKHQYFHPFLVSCTFFSTVLFCCASNAHFLPHSLPTPYLTCFAVLFSIRKITLFIKKNPTQRLTCNRQFLSSDVQHMPLAFFS